MVHSAILFALAAASPARQTPVSKVNRAAITYVITQLHGSRTRINSLVVVDNYALVWGSHAGTQFYDGMKLRTAGWHVACSTGQAVPSAPHLARACGFPADVALRLVDEQGANMAAEHGLFDKAVIAETTAHNASHTTSPFERNQERARLQLLNQLKLQMQLGQITRAQAIQRWNQFQISF